MSPKPAPPVGPDRGDKEAFHDTDKPSMNRSSYGPCRLAHTRNPIMPRTLAYLLLLTLSLAYPATTMADDVKPLFIDRLLPSKTGKIFVRSDSGQTAQLPVEDFPAVPFAVQ